MSKQLSLISELNFSADQLGLRSAELARILGLHCDDVSDSEQLEIRLDYDQIIHHKAERVIALYHLLKKKFNGNSVDMVSWIRKPQTALSTTPFLSIVDHAGLEEVIALLQQKTS